MSKPPFQSPATVADEEFSTRTLLTTVNARVTRVAVMTSAVSLGLLGLLFSVFPLKKSVPYVVHVNQTTGEVSVPASQISTEFNPTWSNEAFFLRRWVIDLFAINQYLTVKQTDPRAQQFLRGQNAITEYTAFRNDDGTFARLAADPSLTRDVSIENFTAVAGTNNAAVALVTLTTHVNGTVKIESKLVTVYFILLPSNDPADLAQNPIGIYVTDFKVSQKN